MKTPTLLLLALIAVVGCGSPPSAEETTDQTDEALRAGGAAPIVLPTASLTPGAVLTVDVPKICTRGYPATVRNITSGEKQKVAAAYHYTGPSSGVEYDHLISLELGGSNDATNLWPEPIAEAHIKDRLENFLHRQVCAGKMQLPDVQARIAANWIQLWRDVGQP